MGLTAGGKRHAHVPAHVVVRLERREEAIAVLRSECACSLAGRLVVVESAAHDAGIRGERMAGLVVPAKEERRVDPQLHVSEEERQAVDSVACRRSHQPLEFRFDVVQLG